MKNSQMDKQQKTQKLKWTLTKVKQLNKRNTNRKLSNKDDFWIGEIKTANAWRGKYNLSVRGYIYIISTNYHV